MDDETLDKILMTAKPDAGRDEWLWRPDWVDLPAALPDDVFALLDGGRFDRVNVLYPTEEAAFAALVRAVRKCRNSLKRT